MDAKGEFLLGVLEAIFLTIKFLFFIFIVAGIVGLSINAAIKWGTDVTNRLERIEVQNQQILKHLKKEE